MRLAHHNFEGERSARMAKRLSEIERRASEGATTFWQGSRCSCLPRAPDSIMCRASFALAVGLSFVLPATARAKGLPSAFDPTVFTLALCDFRPDPNAIDFQGSPCYGTTLEGSPESVNLHGLASEWQYLIYSDVDDHAFFVGSEIFKTRPMVPVYNCCGVMEKGFHRYDVGGEFLPPGTPEGWELYLETKWTPNEYVYGVFARPPGSADFARTASTVTPEPATWLLLGSGMAGVAALRRRRKKAP